MRVMTAAAIAELSSKLGTEPVLVFEIQWTNGGSLYLYGDIDDEVNDIRGRVLEVTGLDNVITISGVTQATTGESSQIGVVLDDRDGSLKSIIDQNDIHKQPASVYQWFPNLDFSDRFLLFKGQISSPIEWHEGDRTVRFDIINQLEGAEVGFSVEEGNIRFIPDDLVGKAWPLVFGTCIHVPALKLRQVFSGTLRTGFGVHDFTIACKLDQIKNLRCPVTFRGYHVRFGTGSSGAGAFAVWAEEEGCACRRFSNISKWTLDLQTQRAFEFETLEVINGEMFPQNEHITLDICGAKVKGKMNGSTLTVSSYTHPKRSELTCPKTKRFFQHTTAGQTFDEPDLPVGFGAFGPGIIEGSCTLKQPTDDRTGLGWDYLATFPTADFFWAEPGCEVFLDGDNEIVYVVNLLPSTILRVAAYRTFESGIRELVTVPASLYTTRISDFNGYLVTEIVLDGVLSRRGEGWEDEIYVSQTSSVGPNTVDIIEWLIDKYTDFAIDTASFDDVRAKIDNYPSSFPLLERRNIFEVLRDIAFQARCALYLRNDVFTIRYLSEEPDSDFTINEDDVLPKSLVLTHTPTEELVTKLVAEWKYDYAFDEPNKVILRYNIRRYGTQEETFNFFIYNIHELVEKSATFWLIRMANTWKKLKFKTPITKLQSEVFDCAEITLPDFSPNTIKSFVEKASFDSETHEMEFELWTPVRAGETQQFIFAWPSEIEIDNIWPTLEDRNLGNASSGPNVDVEAPELHPLTRPSLVQGFSLRTDNCDKVKDSVGNEALGDCRNDNGDKRPSDKDDTKPETKVPGEGETEIPDTKNPTGEVEVGGPTWIENEHALQEEADKAAEVARDNLANDGGEGTESGNPPDSPLDALGCNDDEIPECNVIVFWTTHLVNSVQEGTTIKDQCGETGELSSFPGPSDLTEHSLAVNSLQAAEAIHAALEADYFSTNTVCEYHIAPGSAGITGESAWNTNGCEEPDEITVTSYCGDSDKLGGVEDVLLGI
jgi:hypothetical protein